MYGYSIYAKRVRVDDDESGFSYTYSKLGPVQEIPSEGFIEAGANTIHGFDLPFDTTSSKKEKDTDLIYVSR